MNEETGLYGAFSLWVTRVVLELGRVQFSVPMTTCTALLLIHVLLTSGSVSITSYLLKSVLVSCCNNHICSKLGILKGELFPKPPTGPGNQHTFSRQIICGSAQTTCIYTFQALNSFWQIWSIPTAVDALAPCVNRASATMILNGPLSSTTKNSHECH